MGTVTLAAAAGARHPVPSWAAARLPRGNFRQMSAVVQPPVSTADDLPLAVGAPARVLVFDGAGTVSLGEFMEQAHALSARLPDARCVAHLSADRYRFLLGF